MSVVPTPSSGTAGTMVTVTPTATCDGTPEYRFWLQSTNGGWTMVQDYGVGGTYAWDTTSLPDGTYTLGVWARDVGSMADFETSATVPFVVSASTSCSSVDVTFAPTSPQNVGTGSVVLTATATCEGIPDYQFWLQGSNGGWSVAQAYGGGSTYTWDTSSLAVGDYTVGIWTRNTGESAAYDVSNSAVFTISTPCVVAPVGAVGVSLASPRPSGTTVTVTPTGTTGCTTPEYRFWVEDVSTGLWTMVQDYGVGNTYDWTPSSNGNYALGFWVRAAGTSVAYDGSASAPYDVAPAAACTGATLSFLPTSPAVAGTMVTLTGSATCDAAEFQFWAMAVDGNWSTVQAYGGASVTTYSWDTSGLTPGDYRFGIWTRETGASLQYDSAVEQVFTVN